MPDERRGLLLLVGAAFWFSVMNVLVKVAGRDLPMGMAVFARCVVTLILSYAVVRRNHRSLRSNDTGLLVLRGLFGLGAILCVFHALLFLPLAEATVLQYLNPLLTTLLAAVVLGERAGGSVVLGLALALTGTMLMARPAMLFGGSGSLSQAGVLLGVTGATLSSCAYVTIRKVTRRNHPDVVAFYFPLVATPVTLLFALPTWTWPSSHGWVLLVAIGGVTHMGQLWLTRGLALVPAGRGTTLGYLQIVFATLWGMLLFGEIPNPWTLSGAALIVLAAYVLMRNSGAATQTGSAQSPSAACTASVADD